MATFNAIDMGIVESCESDPAPKARQVTGYPGVNGLESLDMGGRGGTTVVRGVFAGTSAADLAAIKATWRALQQDGGAYTLVDPDGTTWLDVVLLNLRVPGPRFLVVSTPTGVAQRYEAEFLHLD